MNRDIESLSAKGKASEGIAVVRKYIDYYESAKGMRPQNIVVAPAHYDAMLKTANTQAPEGKSFTTLSFRGIPLVRQ